MPERLSDEEVKILSDLEIQMKVDLDCAYKLGQAMMCRTCREAFLDAAIRYISIASESEDPVRFVGHKSFLGLP